MRTQVRKSRTTKRRDTSERGVALVLVMIFLTLMLLLGLGATMTSITEVSVGGNLRLANEAFNTADSGAAHAFELTRNMRGDFTCLLRGPDNVLHSGDEFTNYIGTRIFKLDGTVLTQDKNQPMFDASRVRTLTRVGGVRSMFRLDARHLYELIAYDNAGDPKSWLADAPRERAVDTANNPSIDGDRRIIIRSIGYVMPEDVPADLSGYKFYPRAAISSAVVDIVIGQSPYPAVISNDDLEITNSVTISGSLGSVHANDDLVLGSGNFNISQTATFSNGTADSSPKGSNSTSDNSHVTGFNGPADGIVIPDLNPYEYAAKAASYLLITPGAASSVSAFPRLALADAFAKHAGGANLTSFLATNDAAGDKTMIIAVDRNAAPPTFSVVAIAKGGLNLAFPAGAPAQSRFQVSIASNSGVSISAVPAAGNGKAIFVLMPVGSSQTVNSNGNMTGEITIMTNGSVSVNGNANLKNAISLTTSEPPPWNSIAILVLAGEDIVMNGNAAAGNLVEAVLYAHEQFELSGNGFLSGQVIGYDRALAWNLALKSFVSDTSGSNPGSFSRNPLVGPHGSVISGNYTVTHNTGSDYLGGCSIAAWRQLRDFDPDKAAR